MIGAIGDDRFKTRLQALEALECIESLVPILQPFKLASREVRPTDTVVQVDGVRIGGGHLAVMAGPCSVESPEQLALVARGIKAGGGHILRGGAFKPRTSPYAFQGLEEEGLRLLAEARKASASARSGSIISAASRSPSASRKLSRAARTRARSI